MPKQAEFYFACIRGGYRAPVYPRGEKALRVRQRIDPRIHDSSSVRLYQEHGR